MNFQQNPSQENIKLVEQYLENANIKKIRCIDERKGEIPAQGEIAIPGGIYGIIDAIKHISGCSEDQAWQKAKAAGIPLDGHIDEDYGANGCQYGKLAENQHDAIMAPEAIPVEQRLNRIKTEGGTIQILKGNHHPTHAVINSREGCTINTDTANADNLGIFNFDMWAVKKFAEMLDLDANQFSSHLEQVYKKTVMVLTSFTESDFIYLD